MSTTPRSSFTAADFMGMNLSLPMTRRDAQANPLLGAFDFENPRFKKLVLPLREDCPYGTSETQFAAGWPFLRTIGTLKG